MKKVVFYARYSSENQDNYSIEAQISEMKAFAEKQGWEIYPVKFIDKAVSGSSSERNEFNRLLELALSPSPPFDIILVHEFSRFARDIFLSNYLKYKLKMNNIELRSVLQPFNSLSREGKIIGVIEDLKNDLYLEDLKLHTIKGLKQNLQMGFNTGGVPPVGYKSIVVEEYKLPNGKIRQKKKWVIDEKKAKYIRQVFKDFLNGNGYKKIAEKLNKAGIKTSYNKPFTKSSIRAILSNEHYTGTKIWNKSKRVYNKRVENPADEWIIIKNHHPAIIDYDTFNKAQEKLNSYKDIQTEYNKRHHYLLAGKLFCTCESRFVSNTLNRYGKIYYRYKCERRIKEGDKACVNLNLKETEFNHLVLTHIRHYFLDKRELFLQELNQWYDAVLRYRNFIENKVLEIKEKVEKLKADSETLLEALKIKSSKLIIEKIEEVEIERKALLKDLDYYRKEINNVLIDKNEIYRINEFFKKEVQNLPDLSYRDKRDFIEAYIEKIIINPDEKSCSVYLGIDCNKILFRLGVRVVAGVEAPYKGVCAGDGI